MLICCPLAGSIKLELIDATGLTSDELAKCLPSATINVDADCNVYIGAPAADNSYVNALWSSDSSVTSYQELKLCPVNGPKVALGADAASATTALGVAVNAYVYGLNAAGTAPAKTSGFTVSVPESGVVYFTKSSSTLKYAITATNSNTAAKFTDSAKLIVATAALLADTDLSLTEGTHYRNPTNVGLACPLGSYGLPLGDFKLCLLCPADTTGDGYSCAACPAGKASGSVGVTNTTGCTGNCDSGKFSQAGVWVSLACEVKLDGAAPAVEWRLQIPPSCPNFLNLPSPLCRLLSLPLQAAPTACPAPCTPTLPLTTMVWRSAPPGEQHNVGWVQVGMGVGLGDFWEAPRMGQPQSNSHCPYFLFSSRCPSHLVQPHQHLRLAARQHPVPDLHQRHSCSIYRRSVNSR